MWDDTVLPSMLRVYIKMLGDITFNGVIEIQGGWVIRVGIYEFMYATSLSIANSHNRWKLAREGLAYVIIMHN